MYPEYMLPDLWVQQVLADSGNRERAGKAISDNALPEGEQRVPRWRRAFALISVRRSAKRRDTNRSTSSWEVQPWPKI
jgi:hypothetical protein